MRDKQARYVLELLSPELTNARDDREKYWMALGEVLSGNDTPMNLSMHDIHRFGTGETTRACETDHH